MKSPAHSTPADTSAAVNQFMAGLKHPFKPGIAKLRGVILGVDPSVCEGIKWNSPSFRTAEYFATMNLRAKAGIGLILHLGAKARDVAPGGLRIADPSKLLKWLGNDRALVEFETSGEVDKKTRALQALLRQWIKHV
jgi:hypothetical protein